MIGAARPALFPVRVTAVVSGCADRAEALRCAQSRIDRINTLLSGDRLRLVVVGDADAPRELGCMYDQRRGEAVCALVRRGDYDADAESLQDVVDAGIHRTTCSTCLAALIEREEACLTRLRAMYAEVSVVSGARS